MALLDQYGRPVKVRDLPKLQAEPGVTGVRQVWTSSVAAGLTPHRLASILRAADDGDLDAFLTLAEEMEERDPHYLAVLGMRKRVISALTPRVVPASNSAQDGRIADAVREDIAGHDGMQRLIEDILDALGKGFSVVEIDWQTAANRWRPRAFIHRDPRFFAWDRETGRELRLLDETAPTDGLPLEPWHFITHAAALKSGLPFRGGLARIVAFSWMCKAYTLKDWMAFIETYGLPIRLGRYGPEATPEDVQVLFRAVANIGTDAAAVLPEGMQIDFQDGAKPGGDQIFENLARYVDEQISKAVLGQTMTADNGSSMAQAQVHNEVRHDIADADARAVSATLNRDLVRPYVTLNFGVQTDWPKLVIEVPEPEDVAALIEATERMVRLGLKVKSSELRAKLGLSDPEDGDEVIGGAPLPLPDPEAVNTALNRATVPASPDTDEIDTIAAEMLADWRPVMSDLLDPIEAMIAEATSYEEVMERLPAMVGDMRDARLIDVLVRGLFRARAVGDLSDG